jgi:hypothetical protein
MKVVKHHYVYTVDNTAFEEDTGTEGHPFRVVWLNGLSMYMSVMLIFPASGIAYNVTTLGLAFCLNEPFLFFYAYVAIRFC